MEAAEVVEVRAREQYQGLVRVESFLAGAGAAFEGRHVPGFGGHDLNPPDRRRAITCHDEYIFSGRLSKGGE
ncbi:hypothetical protein GCM10009019_17650 [Salarchaeum japonicum]|uniref:Uncharacterized protein n=1 Tax=Salarchaeum japonicum TaxID=555573 RepID=A0AAV3T215_9EURY